MIKISKPSKMKITGKRVGCWSLEARKSCPGSKNSDGSVVEVCQSCYATKGMYRFPVVKAARQENQKDYHRDDWVDDMVKEVSKFDFFRWFDSGDCETHILAKKIEQVIESTPHCKHWLPTRSDKIPTIRRILFGAPGVVTNSLNISRLNNVAVRPSADHIGLNNDERPGVNSYVIRDTDLFEAKRQGIFVCPVTTDKNRTSCDTCTMCYGNDKVAYLVH